MTKIYSNQPLVSPSDQNQKSNNKSSNKFRDVLKTKLATDKLKFSKHAKQRLKSRGIQLGKQDLQKLQQAVTKAKSKGAKESLVMAGQNAYIVSIENDTVITAMNQDNMDDRIVTNIDSAVVMK